MMSTFVHFERIFRGYSDLVGKPKQSCISFHSTFVIMFVIFTNNDIFPRLQSEVTGTFFAASSNRVIMYKNINKKPCQLEAFLCVPTKSP